MREHMQIKICWPDPDATCLEGGCTHCESDGEWVSVTTLKQWAYAAGDLAQRGNTTKKPADAAFRYGAETGWFNMVKRRRTGSREFYGHVDNPQYLTS